MGRRVPLRFTHRPHRLGCWRSTSFLARLMLFCNASLMCMVLVQGLSDEPPATPSPHGLEQVALSPNSLPNANRFLLGSTPDYSRSRYDGSQAEQAQPHSPGARPLLRPSTSAEHRLYETLFKSSNYQKNVRPVQNHLRSIKVRLGVCVMTIDEIVCLIQTIS